jgi:hypothetical protein
LKTPFIFLILFPERPTWLRMPNPDYAYTLTGFFKKCQRLNYGDFLKKFPYKYGMGEARGPGDLWMKET